MRFLHLDKLNTTSPLPVPMASNSFKTYTVTCPDKEGVSLTLTLLAVSPQNACRKAFKYWIRSSQLKRQPKSHEGGFKDVVVEIL